MGTEFETFHFRDVNFDIAIEQNRNIKVFLNGQLQPGWNFRLYVVDDDHVVSFATGPPQEAAPTFRDTFRLAPDSPLWKKSDPIDCDPEILTVEDVIKDMPPWKD